MHDVAWRGMWICVRSKDAQKQLARTSLRLQRAKNTVNDLSEVALDINQVTCTPSSLFSRHQQATGEAFLSNTSLLLNVLTK